MEALSVEECRRFLEVVEKAEWYPLLALALTTGIRPSEYLALKWSDIDWQRGTASVCRTIQVTGSVDDTKRKRSRRIVKLQNFVLEALQELLKTREGEREGNCPTMHELIFVLPTGLPLKQREVKREFRKLLAIAGIRSVRLYDLRHTAATLAIAASVSVGGPRVSRGGPGPEILRSAPFNLDRWCWPLPMSFAATRQRCPRKSRSESARGQRSTGQRS
jgi:integrase